MPARLRFRLLILLAFVSTLTLLAQSTQVASPAAIPAANPHSLVENALTAQRAKPAVPRYTYFKLDHLKNSYKEHVVFGKRLIVDTTTLYEYTWIGDRPYGRVVELQGKPLTGDALALEQARYDQAVADHSGLDKVARAKIDHAYLLDTTDDLAAVLTPAYTLTELRQETLFDHLTHVIDCVPVSSIDPAHPPATKHYQLWITDLGVILRKVIDVLGDESVMLRGSHEQFDNQLIDGDRLPLHSLMHIFFFSTERHAPILLEEEEIYTRYRRFNVTTRILPSGVPVSGPQSDQPQ
jgi:hypothetical protein